MNSPENKTCAQCLTNWTYDLKCVKCCARLLNSTRPRKDLATSMLEMISKIPGSPSRESIFQEMNK